MNGSPESASHLDRPETGGRHEGRTRELLENMSARPRTPIVRSIPGIRTRWVAFALHPDELVDGRLQIPAELAGRLEERWTQLGFTGATLLRPLGPLEAAGLQPETCPDRLLTLNIMLRARGRLLLAGVPPLESLRADETVAVATDDPLLVHAALPEPAVPQEAADEAPVEDTGKTDRSTAEDQTARTGKLWLQARLRQRGQR